ncbi:Transposase OS=mine drainage metagenome GN=B1A_05471 PE=4 SV=1: DDE_3 [Gemmata massiliana]|uniref:Tc1-like transposase DDE domain-containing protein n=1 Tax=Gemmata massiliana TaxID=1210884 RepID=A0A6P2D2I4_9BACT|nr:Transposase OS=mine drainage metagenome GN=B1A_05471 PE=4 SV=1: DDE_3 [Gemmata massiliana]
MLGAVTVSPRARRLGSYFANRIDGYFGADKVVAFLRNLLRSVPGNVLVVWDGGPAHEGPVIRARLRRNTRLHSDRLPPDAPALNPVELGWSGLKYAQRSDFVSGTRPSGRPDPRPAHPIEV